jgi:hypothetical protein
LTIPRKGCNTYAGGQTDGKTRTTFTLTCVIMYIWHSLPYPTVQIGFSIIMLTHFKNEIIEK